MNVVSSHKILNVSCLNSNAYTTIGGGPWQNNHDLLIDVYFLFEFPKVPLNYSTNVSNLFNMEIATSTKV
jgi:hypothetical protein